MDDTSHRDKPQVDTARMDDGAEPPRVDPGGFRAVFLLTDDEGQQREVSGPVLVGRSPASAATDDGAELWTLTDSTASISKTHALIDVAEATLRVKDLNSTNGTLVNRDGGLHRVGDDWFALQPGDRVFFAHRGVVVGLVEPSSPRPRPGPEPRPEPTEQTEQTVQAEISSLFPQRRPRYQPSVLPFGDERPIRLIRPGRDQQDHGSLFPRRESGDRPPTPADAGRNLPPPPPTIESLAGNQPPPPPTIDPEPRSHLPAPPTVDPEPRNHLPAPPTVEPLNENLPPAPPTTEPETGNHLPAPPTVEPLNGNLPPAPPTTEPETGNHLPTPPTVEPQNRTQPPAPSILEAETGNRFPTLAPEPVSRPSAPQSVEPETQVWAGRQILQGESPRTSEPVKPKPIGAGVFDLTPGQYHLSKGPDSPTEQGPGTDRRQCVECQTQVSPTANFCPGCGAPQVRSIISPDQSSTPPPPSPASSPNRRTTPVWVKVAIVVVAIAIGVGILTGILFQSWLTITVPDLQSSNYGPGGI